MKHVFIGIDGTAQAAFRGDTFYSNVYRLSLALSHKDKHKNPQIFIYQSGVGATINRFFGLGGKLFGVGLDEIILQSYINLVSNVDIDPEKDKIYLFGFSRGAVAVRALSGLISKSRLVKSKFSPSIEDAWHYFVEDKPSDNYRKTMYDISDEVNIEFLGVWDTVYGFKNAAALRASPFKRLRFKNFLLDRGAKTAIHIISIDDMRSYFEPMLWEGLSESGRSQTMEQIWMPGVHSDIGGGYRDDFISTISLLTMIDRIEQYCPDIEFDKEYINTNIVPVLRNEGMVINNERSGYYLITDHKKARKCDNDRSDYNQYVHPLFRLAEGRRIQVRGKTGEYAPSFSLKNPATGLQPARFEANSYNDGTIQMILRDKFGER